MRKFRIAICDDEIGIINIISGAVSAAFDKAGLAAEIDTYADAESLLKRISRTTYDLLFLDICMPRCDGITLCERLRRAGDTTDVIFVSNREDKVFDSLRVHPFGFVRKNSFLNDIDLVLKNYLATLPARDAYSLTVQGKGGIVTVKIAEMVYFEGMGKYQLAHTTGKAEPIAVYRTMEKLESELEPFGFIRIHKGMLVNHRFISRILVGEVELSSGERLPLSRRKATEIKAKYLSLLKESGSVIL